MNALRPITALIIFLWGSLILNAQDQKPANLDTAPPRIAYLGYREIYPGKSADYKKLMITLSRGSDRVETQKFWIDLESLTGNPQEIIFSPFDSYEHMAQSNAEWSQLLGAHPDLDRAQQEIEGEIGSQSKIIAVRRDDLGYLVENIDFSEMRFLHILEVRVLPGHEGDFAESFKIVADAYSKIHSDVPWAVYQIDAGTSVPAFIVIRPMAELKQNDDILTLGGTLADAEGEQSVETLTRIARESVVSTESNLYAVNPEMSHVSKAFAGTDPKYWIHRPNQEIRPEIKADPKSPSSH
ncbi:MAG TPA: hypothetical protein VK709_17630 [Candidatus Saccharimonadales bacterium]|jgi:hypothetical protein|nr:hypothetical protein [Candidatus Saccharimonadales bacterium]